MPESGEWPTQGDHEEEEEGEDFPISESSAFPLDENWLEKSPLAAQLDRRNPLDPLGLTALCAGRLRERALILDLPDLIQAVLSRVATHCDRFEPGQPLRPWLLEWVDDALDALIFRDIEDERDGSAELCQGRFSDLEIILAIERDQTPLACVTLNTLEDEVRHVFYEVCIMNRTERDMQREGYPLERTQELIERAVEAVNEALKQANGATTTNLDDLDDPHGGMGDEDYHEG